VVFGLLDRDLTPAEKENVALKLISPNGEIQRVLVPINGNLSEGTTIGVLAASSIIRYSFSPFFLLLFPFFSFFSNSNIATWKRK
jgi:hypothetical protein